MLDPQQRKGVKQLRLAFFFLDLAQYHPWFIALTQEEGSSTDEGSETTVTGGPGRRRRPLPQVVVAANPLGKDIFRKILRNLYTSGRFKDFSQRIN